jgi:hypothetical protein
MLITLFINIREQVEVFMLKKKVRDMFRKAKDEKERREALEDADELQKLLNCGFCALLTHRVFWW